MASHGMASGTVYNRYMSWSGLSIRVICHQRQKDAYCMSHARWEMRATVEEILGVDDHAIWSRQSLHDYILFHMLISWERTA
jgi:hypothetical protein